MTHEPNPLKSWRTDKGLSTELLAGLIEVDPATVRSYETGRRVPRPLIMMRIEQVSLGRVTASDLLRACAGADLPAHAAGAGCEATPAPAAGA